MSKLTVGAGFERNHRVEDVVAAFDAHTGTGEWLGFRRRLGRDVSSAGRSSVGSQ